jgi:hypothetical protein
MPSTDISRRRGRVGPDSPESNPDVSLLPLVEFRLVTGPCGIEVPLCKFEVSLCLLLSLVLIGLSVFS